MATKYTSEDKRRISRQVFNLMEQGVPLGKACKQIGIPKGTVQDWIKASEELTGQYAIAREALLEHWAEEVATISDEDPMQIVDQNGIARYDSAAVQHQRLRVDSRKWLLSKLKPKQYGDKIVTEHSGVDGGPITLAGLDLKNLSDDELEKMNLLLSKVANK